VAAPPSRVRKVATLHAPLGRVLVLDLLQQIEDSLRKRGATNVWISADSLPDLTLMAEIPEMEDE
jgi:hypothetical protein